MKTYARVVAGEVVELIQPVSYPSDSPDGIYPPWLMGDDIPLEQRYTAEFCAECVDITGITPQPQQSWTYDGVTFSPPVADPVDEETLAVEARTERERLLRNNYDPGIMMALRALRMASTPEETSYAEGKVSELDVYAEALLVVPDQVGFPQTIIWPTAPTK